jgi:EAL domain-containing protein (putative c-di-GMP-specific phosphodiesterase class I)
MAFDGGDFTANSIGLDVRLVQALQTASSAGAGHARAWIKSVVSTCAGQGVRVCAYRIPSYEALQQLKSIGVDEVEGTVFTPALPAGLFMALVTKVGLENEMPATNQTQKPRRKAGSF